jgi:hypothetical protein
VALPSTNRSISATLVAVAIFPVIVGCSRGPDISADLGAEDIGCLVTFGDQEPRSVGPIHRTRSAAVDITDDTVVVIGNSPEALHVSVRRGLAERNVIVDHEDIPGSGYVLNDTWIDADHPGYEIVCRRG